jgi:hypothetical protein
MEVHNVYSSPNIIRMTKSRRMRLGGNGREEECIPKYCQPAGEVRLNIDL